MGLHTPIETHGSHHSFGVEIFDLRHFNSHHLRPLLEQETRLWNDLMSWDYKPSAEMILRYVDSKSCPDMQPWKMTGWEATRFSFTKAARA